VTSSAHGSPLSKWDNRAFWDTAEPADFGLIGDAGRDIDFSSVVYLTDTGRSWASDRTNLRDRVAAVRAAVDSTDDLIRFLQRQQAESLCLQTHPERWSDSLQRRIRSASLDGMANLAKLAIRWSRRSS
jgi:hypothetical protein